MWAPAGQGDNRQRGPQTVLLEALRPLFRAVCLPVDLDGDGDLDVLSASSADGKIAWYENE